MPQTFYLINEIVVMAIPLIILKCGRKKFPLGIGVFIKRFPEGGGKTNLYFPAGGTVYYKQFLHAVFIFCASLLQEETAHFQQPSGHITKFQFSNTPL